MVVVRRIARSLPGLTISGGVVGLLLATHTPPLDLVRYAVYLIWGAVLPGVLLYRAIRENPHSLLDDLAMGTVLGFTLELVAYLMFAAAGLLPWLMLWPLPVVAPFALVPRLRRYWRRPEGYHTPPTLWSWTVAGIALYYQVYTAVVLMRPTSPIPTGSQRFYLHDLLYLMSLVGEYKNRFPARVPQVAGEPLNYHWFSFAHEATASLISHVDTPVAFLRMGQPVLGLLAVALLAVAGWRVSGKPWVGALAATLMFGFGEVVVGSQSLSLFGSSTTSVWTSYSTLYAWLFTTALIITVADRLLPDGLPGAPIGPVAWVLVAAFAVMAVGSKASALPPAIAGVALAGGVELLRRRRIALRTVLLGSLPLAAYGFATVVIFRFESHGVRFHPWYAFDKVTSPNDNASTGHYLTAFTIAAACYVCYELSRLIGIPVLGWLAARGRAAWGPLEWFLLGGIIMAVGGTILLYHPSTSQLYFLRSGWAFGAILSALGYVALVERRAVSPRLVAGLLAGCSLGSVAVTGALWYRTVYRNGPPQAAFPLAGKWLVMPVVREYHLESLTRVLSPILAIAAGAAVVAVAWFGLRRWRRELQSTGVVLATTLVMTAGAAALPQDAYFIDVALRRDHKWVDQVTPEQAMAMRWLRDHSGPDDVIATNWHAPLSFWINSYSERRTLVGSWHYVPRSVNAAHQYGGDVLVVPFWDQRTLAANDAAIYEPTSDRTGWLRDRGVRWIVVNRTDRPESPNLARFATLRRVAGSVAIYDLSDR